MKKTVFALALCLSLLAGCTPAPEPSPAWETPVTVTSDCKAGAPTLTQDEVPDWVSCRIVDGAEEGELLLAELDYALTERERSRHDGKSVYRLSLGGFRCEEELQPDGTVLAATYADHIPVFLDGEPAEPSDLKDGMSVEVSFNGTVMETFPAQLGQAYELHAYSMGTPQSPGGSFYDLCGLYLQVLDDLWETDPGLNSDVALAGLDLSDAPGALLDSEKSALAWRFGEVHAVEVVEGTYEELAEEGYLTAYEDIPDLYRWEDGCLFTISANHQHDDEIYFAGPILFFNAQKWRSPLGAYFFGDCSVLWPQMGTWSSYKVGQQAIS